MISYHFHFRMFLECQPTTYKTVGTNMYILIRIDTKRLLARWRPVIEGLMARLENVIRV